MTSTSYFVIADLFFYRDLAGFEEKMEEYFSICAKEDASYNVRQSMEIDQIRNRDIA